MTPLKYALTTTLVRCEHEAGLLNGLGIWVDERTGQFPHVRTVGAGVHREG
jgi:hypothetical protein